MIYIRKDLLDIFDRKGDVPDFRTRGNKASTSPAIVFSDVVVYKLTSNAAWKAEYSEDKECSLMTDLIENLSMIKKPNVEKLYYSYRGPIRRKLVIMDEDMIILKETI